MFNSTRDSPADVAFFGAAVGPPSDREPPTSRPVHLCMIYGSPLRLRLRSRRHPRKRTSVKLPRLLLFSLLYPVSYCFFDGFGYVSFFHAVAFEDFFSEPFFKFFWEVYVYSDSHFSSLLDFVHLCFYMLIALSVKLICL